MDLCLSDFFQNWVQYSSQLSLTLYDLTLLGSRPAIGDFSKFPQGAAFSLAEVGGVVESSAEPNLLWTAPWKVLAIYSLGAVWVKVIWDPGLRLLLVLISA